MFSSDLWYPNMIKTGNSSRSRRCSLVSAPNHWATLHPAQERQCAEPLWCLLYPGSHGTAAFHGITQSVVQTQAMQDSTCHLNQLAPAPALLPTQYLLRWRKIPPGEQGGISLSFPFQLGLASACEFLSKAQTARTALRGLYSLLQPIHHSS